MLTLTKRKSIWNGSWPLPRNFFIFWIVPKIKSDFTISFQGLPVYLLFFYNRFCVLRMSHYYCNLAEVIPGKPRFIPLLACVHRRECWQLCPQFYLRPVCSGFPLNEDLLLFRHVSSVLHHSVKSEDSVRGFHSWTFLDGTSSLITVIYFEDGWNIFRYCRNQIISGRNTLKCVEALKLQFCHISSSTFCHIWHFLVLRSNMKSR